eukprot:12605405-Heterocapsa_arctica.AAC.1
MRALVMSLRSSFMITIVAPTLPRHVILDSMTSELLAISFSFAATRSLKLVMNIFRLLIILFFIMPMPEDRVVP